MLPRRCILCCDTSITRSWHGQCVNSSALKAAPSWRAGSLKGSLKCGRISLSTGKTVWSACLPDGSRVRRESHARFCERPVVQSHRPTHPRCGIFSEFSGWTEYLRTTAFGNEGGAGFVIDSASRFFLKVWFSAANHECEATWLNKSLA